MTGSEETDHGFDVLLEPALLERAPELRVGALARRIEVLAKSSWSHSQHEVEKLNTRQRTFEALRILRDDRQARAQAVEANLADIDAVNEDRPRLGLDNAVQKLQLSISSHSTSKEPKPTIVNELFPAPVRPQTPTFSPPLR